MTNRASNRVLETTVLANQFYGNYFQNFDGNDDNSELLMSGGLLPGVFVEYGRSPYGRQNGDGLGSMFRSLFRVLLPVAKSAGKQLLKHGALTATNIAHDLAFSDSARKDPRAALKRRLDETEDRIVGQVQNKMSRMMEGSGINSGKSNKRIAAMKTLFSRNSKLGGSGCSKTQRCKRTGKFVTAKRKSSAKRRKRRTSAKRKKSGSSKRRKTRKSSKSKKGKSVSRRRRRRTSVKRKVVQLGSGFGGSEFDTWL